MAAAPMIRSDLELSASVIRRNQELERLGPEWKELFRRVDCDNIFLSFEWMSEWWFHLGQVEELFVVAVRDGTEQLVAVAPLYISSRTRRLRVRRLGFLGDRSVGSDYLDFLVDKGSVPEVVEHLCRFILKHRCEWDYVELSDTMSDSIGATQFSGTMSRQGMSSQVVGSSVCPYVRLPDTPDAYLGSLSSKLSKNLKYCLRALARQGEVEIATITGVSSIESAFDDLLRLHSARLAQRESKSTFVDSKVAAFHHAALRSLSEAGRARIYVLKLQGKPLAALYGFSAGERFFFYQSGFDPAYSRFSVGSLLISFAIQDAIRTGHSEFDFLRGNEPYKTLWSNDTRQLYTLRLFDHRRKSRIVQAAHMTRESLRRCQVALWQDLRSLFQVRPVHSSTS